jgi:4'-phosphopantetheinyl transferase
MLNRAFDEANFIRFGSCRSENAPNFLWAVAASQMLSEPVWRQHPDVGSLIDDRLKLK